MLGVKGEIETKEVALSKNRGAVLKYVNWIAYNTDISDCKVIHIVRNNLFNLSLSACINNGKDIYHRPTNLYKGKFEGEIPNLEDVDFKKLHPNSPYTTDEFYNKCIKGYKIKISPGDLALRMRGFYKRAKIILKKIKTLNSKKILKIYYEDITKDRNLKRLTDKRVCKFLNVSNEILTAGTVKLNVHPIEYIENWKEIENLEMDLRLKYKAMV